jgi:hypothetical protein
MPTKSKKTVDELNVKSLARAYTAPIVKQLGSWACAPEADAEIRIRAMGMLLDRGWGKPQQDANVQAEIRVTIRKLIGGEDK